MKGHYLIPFATIKEYYINPVESRNIYKKLSSLETMRKKSVENLNGFINFLRRVGGV